MIFAPGTSLVQLRGVKCMKGTRSEEQSSLGLLLLGRVPVAAYQRETSSRVFVEGSASTERMGHGPPRHQPVFRVLATWAAAYPLFQASRLGCKLF